MRYPRMTALLPIAGLLLAACGGPTQVASTPTATSPKSESESATEGACRAADLKALPTIPSAPQQPGTVTVRVYLANNGDRACTINGVPRAVAIADKAGSSSPKGLAVTPDGKADPVTLAPGDTAIAFVSSAETDDFKCASGAAPTRAPVVLVGVPDELVELPMVPGSSFTECADAVTVTPWQPF